MDKKQRQAIFDDGIRAIISQGGRAVDEGGCCQYRSDHGRKCFAGHFIPDGIDFSLIEGRVISDFQSSHLDLVGWTDLSKDDRWFLGLCQDAHDDGYTVSLFKLGMQDVAIAYGLDTSVLSELPARWS